MRTAEEITSLVLSIASKDEKIRAVLLTGSRANPGVKADILQDYDIIYVVKEMDTFVQDKSWIDVFGQRRILQLPEEMTIGEKDEHAYHYLMLFIDHVRIDLTLYPFEKMHTGFMDDTLATVLLDKDNRFDKRPPANDSGYRIKPPVEKEFADCCNEFWWVSTYVAKGLWRKEIIYAKEAMEGPVREMFMKMVTWFIGMETAFEVNIGKGGKYMQQYLKPELYTSILATYPDGNIENMWTSLFRMTTLFHQLATEVAVGMQFWYNQDEAKGVSEHLQWVFSLHGKS